jgi:hypothetical protein
MSATCRCSASEPPMGPITQQQSAKSYFDKHRLSQVFRCLMAGLMVECPADYVTYLDAMVAKMQYSAGDPTTDLNKFDQFIKEMHPTNSPIHRELIKSPRSHTPPSSEQNDIDKDFELPLEDVDYFMQQKLDVDHNRRMLPLGHIDYFTQDLDEQIK